MSSPTWSPSDVLGLAYNTGAELLCVGRCRSGERPCSRTVPASDMDTVNAVLMTMAHQMPDQIDHNLLLRLARACLCVDGPKAHRGQQEASVIYRWTELLSTEAQVLRRSLIKDGSPPDGASWTTEVVSTPRQTRVVPPEATSPTDAKAGEEKLSTTICVQVSPRPHRPFLGSRSRLLTELDPACLPGDNPLTLPTPKPMELGEDMRDRWESETLVSSPASMPSSSPVSSVGSPRKNPPRSTSGRSATPAALNLNLSSRSPSISGHHHLPPTPPNSGSSRFPGPHQGRSPIQSSRSASHPSPRPRTAANHRSSRSQTGSDAILTTTLAAHPRNPLQDLPLATPAVPFAQLESYILLLHETREQHSALLAQTAQLRTEIAHLKRERDATRVPIPFLVMFFCQFLLLVPGLVKSGMWAWSVRLVLSLQWEAVASVLLALSLTTWLVCTALSRPSESESSRVGSEAQGGESRGQRLEAAGFGQSVEAR